MLDVQTLILASVTARVGFIVIFVIASFRSEAYIAFRFWTASIFASMVGILLIYTDTSYPYYSAAHGLVIFAIIGLSVSSLWAGGCVFFGHSVSRLRFAMMGFVPGIVYCGAQVLGMKLNMGMLLANATLAYAIAVAARIFLINTQRGYLPSQLLVGVVLMVYALTLFASAVILAISLLRPSALANPLISVNILSLLIDQFISVLTYVGLIGMSLEDSQVRIRAIASKDPLTGLANRRGLQEQAAAMRGVSRRAKLKMALLIADIDHFKLINDRYGHSSGDEVLKEFARRFSTQCRREQDVTGRWGGEEFLAVLSDMTLAEAVVFAERLCQRVSEEPFDIGNEAITVTVSIGVAEIDDYATSLEQAVKNADAALYDAKRRGRNRVCSAENAQPATLRDDVTNA